MVFFGGGNSPLDLQAGASLESLAKGAVQFSRRFTVRELQDRWHSLLYDPVLSGEASARMIEFECSASTLPLKFNRFGNPKENKCVPGKRKAENVRSCYYALRKRICNEPFNSMDLSFLVAPSNSNCVGNEDEPLSANYILEVPISNHFGTQEPSLDIMHCAFPQMVDNASASVAGTSAHGLHAAVQNPVNGDFPIEQNSIHEEIPQVREENLPHTGNCSGIDELGQPKELLACDLFETDDLEEKPPTFDLINSDLGNVCSEFGGNQTFNLPGSDCDASFDNLEYSSPLPGMPIWDTVEGISDPAIPVDASLGKKDHHSEDTFVIPDHGHAEINSVSGYDVPSETKLKSPVLCDQLNNSSPDGYLVELSSSLLDFPNDELLFMDVDGNDIIDKSYYDGLNSLLLSSPTNSNQDPVPDITEPEASVGPDAYLVIPQGACPGELDNNGSSFNCGDGHTDCNPEAQTLSSVVDSNPQFPEMCNGVICCSLNAEDPDIPCNDDVLLPNQVSLSSLPSSAQLSFHEANNPASSSVKDFTNNQKSSERCPSLLKRELKSPRRSHVSSQMIGSQALTKTGLNHTVGDCDIKFELTESNSKHGALRNSSLNPASVKAHAPLPKMLKEESKEIKPARQISYNSTDSLVDKPGHGSDRVRSYLQTNACGIKQEIDALSPAQNHQALDFASLDPVVNPSSPDQEEQPIESDDEIPYVSDIEAMVHVKYEPVSLIGNCSVPPFGLVCHCFSCFLGFFGRYLIWIWIQMTKSIAVGKVNLGLALILSMKEIILNKMKGCIMPDCI